MIDQVKDYFITERVTVIDVIIISLITSFLTWLLKGFFLSTAKFIKRVISKSYKRILKLYKLIVHGKMSINELIKLERRLENGGKIRCYEKKAYTEYQLSKEKLSESMRELKPQFQAINEQIRNFNNNYKL